MLMMIFKDSQEYRSVYVTKIHHFLFNFEKSPCNVDENVTNIYETDM